MPLFFVTRFRMAHAKNARLLMLNVRRVVRTDCSIKNFIPIRLLTNNSSKFYATLARTNQQQVENVKNLKAPAKLAVDEKTPLTNTSQKRPQRKLRVEHVPNIYAYSTAEQYDFDSLRTYLLSGQMPSKFSLRPVTFELSDKVIRLVCRTEIGNVTSDVESVAVFSQSPCLASSEVLIFNDGSTVMWNVAEKDRLDLLDNVLPKFEIGSFTRQAVKSESEKLSFVYTNEIDDAHFKADEILRLRTPMTIEDDENFLNRYAISDAMSRSVKLAIRENALSNFVDTLNPIVEDLKRGRIRVRKGDLLKKTGHLFALRHNISLDSDLLDNTPDFYWDRDQLEKLYTQASRIFCIENRTKVINEKLTYCLQLGERLDGHLNATHSVRLERIIIFLIAIEVAFEFWPYGADYYRSIMNRGKVVTLVD